MRKRKRREAAATNPEDKQAAQIRQRLLKQEYEKFSKVANLRTQPERMEVYIPKRAENKSTVFTSQSNKDKINAMLHQTTQKDIDSVPLVQPQSMTEEMAIKLQEDHKSLLSKVKDKPLGTEAYALYTTDMKLIKSDVGADAAFSVAIPQEDRPHIVSTVIQTGPRFRIKTLNRIYSAIKQRPWRQSREMTDRYIYWSVLPIMMLLGL